MSNTIIESEIWKDVKDFEGYQVSNLGRVRSLERPIYRKNGRLHYIQKENILKPFNGGNYLSISFRDNGKTVKKRVHRVVAKAFCRKAAGNNVVNHIDGNKENNKASNLEWVTQKDNMLHAKRIGLNKLQPPIYYG